MAAISNMAEYQDGVYSRMASESNMAASMKYNSFKVITLLTGGNTSEIASTPTDYNSTWTQLYLGFTTFPGQSHCVQQIFRQTIDLLGLTLIPFLTDGNRQH